MIEKSTRIFTDPMGQYPVFYFNKGGSFIVSNNFFAISSLLKEKNMNLDCMIDYVTYLSPLKQETILQDVYRLSSFETLKIENNSLKKVENNNYLLDFSYDELLSIVADRMKSRAKALLDRSSPLCHLTGGSDSRLVLASLLANGFKGSVFSYGDEKSSDRQICNNLKNKYKLSDGTLYRFDSYVNDLHKYIYSTIAFNGLKSTLFTDWGGGVDTEYSEVTGYFGENVKGFGSLDIKKDDLPNSVDYHSYHRKHSNFNSEMFDLADSRILDELKKSQQFDSPVLNNINFYNRNRGSGHFGMHSVVSNKRYISIDLAYDPLFLSLANSSYYDKNHVKNSAITIDLIKCMHSKELATFPYEGRTIPRYAKWTYDIGTNGSNCFEPSTFENKSLRKMRVESKYVEPDIDLSELNVDNCVFNQTSQLFEQPLFKSFFNKYPAFSPALHAVKGDVRRELTSLSSLIVCEFLAIKVVYSFK